MKKIKPIKSVKKAMYKGTMRTLKGTLALMIIGGLLLSMAYVCRYVYIEYAVSKAHVIMNYPEIASSGYPDGSRFAFYDFISDDKLEKALDIMHSRGKYKNFTVDDIKNNFYVYSYLDGSARNAVSTNRSEGNDFSYVANEYDITFVQPHDYKNRDFIRKFAAPDYSDEFLKILIDVNREYISETKGGLKGFETLTALDSSDYDYLETIKVYRTKIKAIISYLSSLEKSSPDFISSKHNLTVKDIKGKYRLLITNKVDGIENFVESSAVSKNTEVASNKINVNIENTLLKHNKANDRALINDYAVVNYDHTFTENLINVVRDNKQGLYQARPKTAFDTVVDQKNNERELVAQYKTDISVLNDELSRFSDVTQTPDENARLTQKAENLIASLEKEYADITAISSEVVSEYLNDTNKMYISADVKQSGVLSTKMLIKAGIAFCAGALFVFVLAIWLSILSDNRELKRKKMLLKEIQNVKEKEVR